MQNILDQFSTVLSTPSLGLLFLTTLLGGLVRGFTGFGFAMVFVPLAAMIIGPVAAVGLIAIINFPFVIPLARRALFKAEWHEVLPLFIGSSLAMPAGVWLLTHLDALATRWIMVVVVALALGALVSGWRYSAKPGRLLSFSVGGLSGLVNGLASVGGVPLVVFWLGSQHKTARQARTNLESFFFLSSLVTMPILIWSGVLTSARLALGMLLMLPYGLGLLIGVKSFWMASERSFRLISYAVIAFSVVASLPLWDSWLGRQAAP